MNRIIVIRSCFECPYGLSRKAENGLRNLYCIRRDRWKFVATGPRSAKIEPPDWCELAIEGEVTDEQ